MINFRRIAWPLAWLLTLWSKAAEQTGVFSHNFPPFTAKFWMFETAWLLIAFLALALMLWGWRAEFSRFEAQRVAPAETRKKLMPLLFLGLLSIPNLLMLMLIADKLNLGWRQTDDLGIAIFATPILLGVIWFRLHGTMQEPLMAKEEAVN